MRPNIPITMNTSENDIDEELYTPCLGWSSYYDRGVGFFTSGWISKNCKGMSEFASNGGKARWITSHIIQPQDYEIIKNASNMKEASIYFNKVLEDSVRRLASEINLNIVFIGFLAPQLHLKANSFVMGTGFVLLVRMA